MKKFFTLTAAFTFLTVLAQGEVPSQFLAQKTATHVELNNRILAVVNETPISVYDVMKKMDFIFFKQYPEYSSSAEARHEFYKHNWKYVLQELIDKELIVADAQDNKLPVTAGDIRQEMENLFGPNIIGTLDKINMTYEEAYKIVQDDITIKRMLYIRVNNKALNAITPQVIRKAYEQYCQENPILPEWKYFVMTIRNKENSVGAVVAQKAYKMLTEEKVEAGIIADHLASAGVSHESQVTISDLYCHSEKELSPAYKEILQKLKPSQYSAPIAQKSRVSGNDVYRIFYLDDYKEGALPDFEKLQPKLKEEQLSKMINKETVTYLDRLRKYYRVDKEQIEALIPSSFEPFILK